MFTIFVTISGPVSGDHYKMEINSDEVREHLNFSDPDKLDKLKFCEELVLFRSRKSCEMLIEQMQNAINAEADDEQ